MVKQWKNTSEAEIWLPLVNTAPKRMAPNERKDILILGAVALAVGDFEVVGKNPRTPAHFLLVGHEAVAMVCQVSTATAFNYFNTIHDLRDALADWALENLYHPTEYTRCVAEDLAKQVFSAFPELGRQNNWELVIETTEDV